MRALVEPSPRLAGAEREHVDAGAAQLAPERLGEEEVERLRRAVDREPRVRLMSGERGDDDQPAAAAREHRRQPVVGQAHDRRAVDGDHLLVVLGIVLREAPREAEARIVDQETDLACSDGLADAVACALLREVLGHDQRLHAVPLAQPRRELVEPLPAPCDEDDGEPALRERLRERLAQARAGAGDERPAAVSCAKVPGHAATLPGGSARGMDRAVTLRGCGSAPRFS